jgi:cobalamin biosynthesis protein CobT
VPRIQRICRTAWPVIIDDFVSYRRWEESKPGKARGRSLFAITAELTLMASIDYHIFDTIYQQGAPEGEERNVEEIIGAMQSAIERGQKGLAPVSSVQQLEELFAEYNRRARNYGLDECLVDGARLSRLGVPPAHPATTQ